MRPPGFFRFQGYNFTHPDGRASRRKAGRRRGSTRKLSGKKDRPEPAFHRRTLESGGTAPIEAPEPPTEGASAIAAQSLRYRGQRGDARPRGLARALSTEES